jgi:hypothetical protein
MGGECSTSGEKKNILRVVVGTAGRERQLGTSRCRLEDNIKMYLRETVWEMCGLH